MKYLLFKLVNKNISYAIVSSKVLYLLNDSEYVLLKDSDNQEILKEVNQIKKEQILKLIATKNKREVTIYDLKDHELLKLNFEVLSSLKRFIGAFPEFKREIDESKARINPMNALLVMLFTYSFIWAGTRPTSADINPEGISLRIAYLNVKFLEWLNNLIGQKLILIIGIILLFTLLYFVFRPEIWNFFGQKVKYSNTAIKGTTDNRVDGPTSQS